MSHLKSPGFERPDGELRVGKAGTVTSAPGSAPKAPVPATEDPEDRAKPAMPAKLKSTTIGARVASGEEQYKTARSSNFVLTLRLHRQWMAYSRPIPAITTRQWAKGTRS